MNFSFLIFKIKPLCKITIKVFFCFSDFTQHSYWIDWGGNTISSLPLPTSFPPQLRYKEEKAIRGQSVTFVTNKDKVAGCGLIGGELCFIFLNPELDGHTLPSTWPLPFPPGSRAEQNTGFLWRAHFQEKDGRRGWATMDNFSFQNYQSDKESVPTGRRRWEKAPTGRKSQSGKDYFFFTTLHHIPSALHTASVQDWVGRTSI